ncbi:uncharacterized protein LOC129971891 [Argiope bruennichi]|uniref:uncharacterized protein LOC129971891 n=1 Tax=Argiope bruennichi TaxID=94029 RepID=UPI0024959847|nr:uncharacterized protein LOC129971891 [Argiope bruennichi]
MASDLVVLNRRKGSIRGQLTKLRTFIEKGEHLTESTVITQLDILSRTSTRFEELRNEYYRTVSDNDFDQVESNLSELEDEILKIEVSLKSILHDLKSTSVSNSTNGAIIKESIDKVTSIRLPEIPLPLFNDRESRKQFELSLVNKEVPDFDDFIEFLERRYQVLNAIGHNIPYKSKYSDVSEQKNKARTLFVKPSNNPKYCILCRNADHPLHKCDQFLQFSPQKRYETVREKHLCLNCFGSHKIAQCKSKHTCFTCKAKHHTLLHRMQVSTVSDDSSSINSRQTPSVADPCSSCNPSPLTSCFVTQKKRVILATAVVYVLDSFGTVRKGRALLDSGSMCNLMTSDFANALGLKKEKINVPISGISDTTLNVKRKSTSTILNSDGSFTATLDFLAIPKITDLMPSTYIDLEGIEIPPYVQLADPEFFSPKKVDILIGAEIFLSILKENRFDINNSLILQETVFGHILSGTIQGKQESHHCGLISQIDNLDNLLKKFWEVENILDTPTSKNKEELECEENFMQTYRRDEQGKYIVNLPLKKNMQLGNSIQTAKQRLDSLWKRLNNDPNFSNLYCNFMKEYEQLGHMQKLDSIENVKYVMPHHGVYKADSSTTKLRVVFDASAASTSGVSLNNCLLKGGVVQDDLFSILLRFRKHKVAFTADVKKMYRQIWVNPEQCNFQCILWKTRSSEEPSFYKLLTVTYGTKSAPYLATRVLNQLAIDEQHKFPLASAVTLKDFYVDDVLSGADDVSTAIKLQQELISFLKAGGMDLHKWCANNEMLLESVPSEDQGYQFGDSDKNTIKTLGLKWNPKEDCFGFNATPSTSIPTKRTVLADIAKLFDPLGLLGPVTVKAKIFLQRLWLHKIEWDQVLPHQEKHEWEIFRYCLGDITKMQIPRCILTDSIKEVELHGFADASKDAYGAVIYLRCVTILNHVKVSLLCSKSKVAPIKVMTIPRLELCAAELLAKLASKTVSSLNLKIDKICLYSDSTIVLAWINTSLHLLKVFVSNRISRIQELTKEFSWHHVKTCENPADIISRGMTPHQLMNNHLWWNGPQFLQQVTVELSDESNIPTDDEYFHELKGETTKTLTLSVDATFLDLLLCVTNKYSKLIRIVSFLFRFCNNLRNPKNRLYGPLSTVELQRGKSFLVKSVQEIAFQSDINLLLHGKQPTDIVSDLTSEAFIACLKRFFSRRGKSQFIFSDNGKNFVSGNSELKRLALMVTKHDEYLSNFLSEEGIQWKFLPPRAPNFGGLWEAGVKSFKYHLKRVVGVSKLTYEEFFTILHQIEGILNSRPITPLSSDMGDLEILTPGHFLIGRPITSIVEPNLTNPESNRLNLWQRTSKMVQVIWKRWQNNYLSTLQQRHKWIIKNQNLKIGDMVLLKEENLPCFKWILGRIVNVFYGKDNVC